MELRSNARNYVNVSDQYDEYFNTTNIFSRETRPFKGGLSCTYVECDKYDEVVTLTVLEKREMQANGI